MLLGTSLRNKAFNILQDSFPDAVVLLETARLAAWIGSDLGNICAFLMLEDTNVSLQYYIDMRDAGNADFQKRIIELRNSGHPINWQAVSPLISRGEFITPDFTPYCFTRSLNEVPYLSGHASTK